MWSLVGSSTVVVSGVHMGPIMGFEWMNKMWHSERWLYFQWDQTLRLRSDFASDFPCEKGGRPTKQNFHGVGVVILSLTYKFFLWSSRKRQHTDSCKNQCLCLCVRLRVWLVGLPCVWENLSLWDSVLGLVVRVHHKEVDIELIMVAASHNHKIYWWRHTFCIISTP